MSNPIAPHVVAAGLEIAGDRAMEVYGKQMVKMRDLLGRKAFDATGASGELIGGRESGEGKAGRVRLGLVLEEWVKNGKLNPPGRILEV